MGLYTKKKGRIIPEDARAKPMRATFVGFPPESPAAVKLVSATGGTTPDIVP